MENHIIYIGLIIFIALFFDFANGFHDAANSIATIVSTKVLTPKQAVVWAAFFNFIAAFGLGMHVANTIGKGVVNPEVVNTTVIFAGLVGAIVWDLITWYVGLPTSSSHALIGGFVGAAIVKAGFSSLILSGIYKILLFIVLSPLIGLVLGYFLMVIVYRIFWNHSHGKVNQYFKIFQLFSAAAYSLGHGTNDAQKTMGIISVLLFTSGYLGKTFYVPTWVILSAHAAIALGTLAGGWRIVKTLGVKIAKLEPVHGFCAETSAAISLLGASHLGIPVSTTHTITGAIVGVGATKRLSAVRWGVAKSIIWAWILTIPCSAVIAMISYYILKLIGLD